MGCASSSAAAQQPAPAGTRAVSVTSSSAQGNPLAHISTEELNDDDNINAGLHLDAKTLSQLRLQVRKKDQLLGPPPDAHREWMEESKSRSIDEWIDRTGLDPLREPVSSLALADESMPLSEEMLRRLNHSRSGSDSEGEGEDDAPLGGGEDSCLQSPNHGLSCAAVHAASPRAATPRSTRLHRPDDTAAKQAGSLEIDGA
jgi:hypothetical protein